MLLFLYKVFILHINNATVAETDGAQIMDARPTCLLFRSHMAYTHWYVVKGHRKSINDYVQQVNVHQI